MSQLEYQANLTGFHKDGYTYIYIENIFIFILLEASLSWPEAHSGLIIIRVVAFSIQSVNDSGAVSVPLARFS